jgi:hypothetical protein
MAAFNKMIHQHGAAIISYHMGSESRRWLTRSQNPMVIMMFCGASRPRPTDVYTFRAVQISDQYAPACWASFRRFTECQTDCSVEADTETGNLASRSPLYRKSWHEDARPYLFRKARKISIVLTKAIALKPDGIVGGSTPGRFRPDPETGPRARL